MILAEVIKWHTRKIKEYFHLRFDTHHYLITHTNKTVEPWYNANSQKSGELSLKLELSPIVLGNDSRLPTCTRDIQAATRDH